MEYLEGSAPKIMFTCEYGQIYIFPVILFEGARNKKVPFVSSVMVLTFAKIRFFAVCGKFFLS